MNVRNDAGGVLLLCGLLLGCAAGGEQDGASGAAGPAPAGGPVVSGQRSPAARAAAAADGGGEAGVPQADGGDAAAPQPGPEDPACRAGDPQPEALVPGGLLDERSAIIPGGRAVTPVGTLVPLGRAPVGLALSPDGRWAYVTCDGDRERALQVVDLDAGVVAQNLSGFEAFRGVAATPDGARVVVAAGRSGRLLTFLRDEAGLLQPGPGLDLPGYLGDLTLSPDGSLAYVASNTSSIVYAVDLATLEVRQTYTTGIYPYDLIVDGTGTRLYVSNLGDSTIGVLDLVSGALLAEVPTRKGPEGMVLDEAGSRLFVPCADDDTVVVIDTGTLTISEELDLSHHPEGLLAASPTELALAPDGGTLCAVQADLNQVDLLDAARGELLGSLPTGWYPAAVAAHPDGERLVVVNAKGLGGSSLHMPGLLQVVTLPAGAAELAALTDQTWSNNTRPSRFYANPCASPLPHAGQLPLEHVVLIVRENKTYDMVLGDLEGANGDPALTLFGEEITPNLHALARAFVNMDNFHSDPERSIQGHLWTTQVDCNDFVEKTQHTQLPLAGYEPAAIAGSGSIFEHCLRHGVSFRNYGEITSFGPELLGRLRDFIDPKFPFFNMDIRDEDKAREVIREWNLGIFPQFIYIALPNDHTFGTKPGKPTPESMVADNDRATGMLIDWISKSPYWEKTIVFVIEDDPQSWRGDHVDPHRSICVVVSPWVKRGFVSSVHYNIPSIYRTMEMILGLPPLNKNDALASPMYDIFRTPEEGPDLRPFDALPLAVPPETTPAGSPRARLSEHLDFDQVDGIPGLGEVLWRARKGNIEPPAYAKGIDE